MKTWADIAVVGGVNLDVLGMPDGDFVPRDSMIGRIIFRAGGVGRNIAAQAARARADVSLYTVFGNDRYGEWLKEACLRDGIRIDRSVTLNGPSSVYLAIHDSRGDMAAAINDMGLILRFTPDVLSPLLESIDRSSVCVLDTNLPQESLIYLSENVTCPLVLDPVSLQKALRVIPILDRLTAMKPNLDEARFLTGEKDVRACARQLHKKGLPMAFISMGREGLYYSDGETCGLIPPGVISDAPQTGAGDAVTAGIAIGLSQGLSARECAMLGVQCAEKHLGAAD